MTSEFVSVLGTVLIHLWLETSGSFAMLTRPLSDILSGSRNNLYHCNFEYPPALFEREIVLRTLFTRPEKEGGSLRRRATCLNAWYEGSGQWVVKSSFHSL